MALRFRNPRTITEAEYLHVLENGLPQHSGSQRSVAIVGAGMAGLTSALLLSEAGFQVRLYEASQRVGGRIKTLREGFSQGLHAEAGAMRLPIQHKLTEHLCRRADLITIDFPEADEHTWVLVNGRREKMSVYNRGGAHFGAPYTTGRTATQALDLALDGLSKLKGMERELLDHISLGEYLRAFTFPNSLNPVTQKLMKKALLTQADIDLIGLEFGASDLRVSLQEAIRDHEIINQLSGKYQIKGGMDQLPIRLANQILPLITFNARVTNVARNEGRFRVGFEHTITHRRAQPDRFDYVVLAAPFSALTHVRFDGVLGSRQLHAIRNLHYETATKIVLEFSERFWETRCHIRGGKSFTDLPIRWTYYPSKDVYAQETERGILLASYTWGEDSLRWSSLSNDDRIRFALRDVASLHDMEIEECERLLVGGMTHSWAEDEHNFGAFSIFEPHQETELFDAMWQPQKGIHLAGEHTSLKHGWIEGAVESGIRAACEIYQSVTHRSDCWPETRPAKKKVKTQKPSWRAAQG